MDEQEFADWVREPDYPIRKKQLFEYATARGFDADEVRRALDATPIEEFNSPSSVTEAFAKLSFSGP